MFDIADFGTKKFMVIHNDTNIEILNFAI